MSENYFLKSRKFFEVSTFDDLFFNGSSALASSHVEIMMNYLWSDSHFTSVASARIQQRFSALFIWCSNTFHSSHHPKLQWLIAWKHENMHSLASTNGSFSLRWFIQVLVNFKWDMRMKISRSRFSWMWINNFLVNIFSRCFLNFSSCARTPRETIKI